MINDEENSIEHKKILSSAASITSSTIGAVTGNALGTAFAGPVGGFIGALGGAVLEEIFKSLVEDFGHRILSSREKVKVKMVLDYGLERIQEFIKEGKIPRKDWLATVDETGRSYADEIFEEALFKAQRESQEKKIRFLGYFLANISFDDSVSSELAYSLLKIAEQLSYRQFCFLALIEKVGILNVEPLRGRIHKDLELEILKREEMRLHFYDFGEHGLIDGDGNSSVGDDDFGYIDCLSEVGEVFCRLFELSKIPSQDLHSLAKLLDLSNNSLEKQPLLPNRNKSPKKVTKIDELKYLF